MSISITAVLVWCAMPFAAVDTVPGSVLFWSALEQWQGGVYPGEVRSAPAGDTLFTGKTLTLTVQRAGPDSLRMPFWVGEDRSRTWIVTRHGELLQLRHDHRHADGEEDEVSDYGGMATNSGSARLQVFPADARTLSRLPYAGANVWWYALDEEGNQLCYQLRRMGTDRFFQVCFDRTRPIQAP